MKKVLLMAVAAMMCISLSAQREMKSATPQTNKHVVTNKLAKRDISGAELHKDVTPVNMGHLYKKLTFNASKMQPVARTKDLRPMNQKFLRTNTALSRNNLKNLKPTVNVKAGSIKKAPAFQETYMGMGLNYYTRTDTTWTMTPAVLTATYEDGDAGETTKEVNVLVDPIPLAGVLAEALAELYPQGFPVLYTMDEEGIITIQPQSIAYVEPEEGQRVYLTLFGANSDDGVITMKLAEDGLLKIIDGNWIAIGEFLNVEFTDDFDDDEVFLAVDELITYVTYRYEGQKYGITVEKEFKGYGVDVAENKGVIWTMGQGTFTEDGEDYPILVNMTPYNEMFSGLYPDGIYVDYKQEGNTITVEPTVLGYFTNDDGDMEYIMLFSGTDENGKIVLTVGEDGSLNTIKDESIIIGVWLTEKFDPTYKAFDGYYTYTDRVKYLLPDAPVPAPEDVKCSPNELMLFAGLTYNGYSYQNNLAVAAPYSTQNFINGTVDPATGFSWSVTELTDEERTITADTKDFALTTDNPDAAFTDLSLVGYCEDAASEPAYFGCVNKDDDGNPLYEHMYIYASGGVSSFTGDDGVYPLMSRFNPDGDLAFYTNWSTPGYTMELDSPYSISKLYSYQGKPAAPLFITGVTLPTLNLNDVTEDFNLHMTIYKCVRNINTGKVTLGDVIAEGDATQENIEVTYEGDGVNISIINFNELFVTDEFGLSETLDYLFIEDEFIIEFSGIDNGTFSARFGSMTNDNENLPVLWFEMSGEEGSFYSYNSWSPALLLGLNDATYGYLHTEDNTALSFDAKGGEAAIHIDPMYFDRDENKQPTYLLYTESVSVDGEEVEEIPEWIEVDVANEDYTTDTKTDDDGESYLYFVNGIDYDLVFTVAELPKEGNSYTVTERKAEIVFMQPGARITVTVAQSVEGGEQGIKTMVTKTPVKNSRAYNLAGQSVKSMKGVVVKDGRKMIAK